MEDLMREKQAEMLEKMIISQQKFIESLWYKDLSAIHMAWYRISHKYEDRKTDDWYEVTATPYLEKIK